MAKKLPVYDMQIDENNGFKIDAVALVDNPAIQSDFYAFAKSQKLVFADAEKMELIGAAMIPDIEMFRAADSENPEGYFAKFSATTIRQIAQNFFKNGYTNSFNLNHDDKQSAGSYVFQSYIVDSNAGINAPNSLKNIPDGSWIIGVKVDDPETWEGVKDGAFNGFSVEGFLKKVRVNYSSDELTEIDSLLDVLIDKKIKNGKK